MLDEREEKGMPFLTFLAGAGIGALIGAATALLLAPQSGKESREDVKEAMTRIGSKTSDLAGKVKSGAGTVVQRTREIAGKAASSYRDGKEEVAQAVMGPDSE